MVPGTNLVWQRYRIFNGWAGEYVHTQTNNRWNDTMSRLQRNNFRVLCSSTGKLTVHADRYTDRYTDRYPLSTTYHRSHVYMCVLTLYEWSWYDMIHTLVSGTRYQVYIILFSKISDLQPLNGWTVNGWVLLLILQYSESYELLCTTLNETFV